MGLPKNPNEHIPTKATLQDIVVKLIENGYSPVGLIADTKRPMFAGWTNPDRDIMREFPPNATKVAIGEQATDPLDADADTTDPVILEGIDRLIEELLPPTPLIRIGKAPKSLRMYRMEPRRYLGSIKIKRNKNGRDETVKIEFLGKDNKQAVIFGRHASTGEAYKWLDKTPLEVPFDDVPLISWELAIEFRNRVNKLLEDRCGHDGWYVEQLGGASDGHTKKPALPLDWQFVWYDDGTVCTAGDVPTMPRAQVHNRQCGWPGSEREDAGRWYWNESNKWPQLTSWEEGSWRMIEGHEELVESGKEIEAVEKMTQALLEAGLMKEPEPEDPICRLKLPGLMTVEQLVSRYVLGGRGNGMVHDLLTGREVFKPGTFKAMLGESGGSYKTAPRYFGWLTQCNKFASAALRPDVAAPIFEEGGHLCLNTYRAPAFPESGGDADPLLEWVDRMVLHDDELDMTLDWIHHLLTKPWLQLVGLVMLAAPKGDKSPFGTGRGLLAETLGRCLGKQYYGLEPMSSLIGSTYQSQYTDWMQDKLLVHIGEAVATGSDAPTLREQRLAYDAVKEKINPGITDTKITRKGVASTNERTFCSFFIASNHKDAMAVEEGDRRLLVVENQIGGVSEDDADRYVRWLDDPANLGAVMRWAASYKPVHYTNPMRPPDSRTKQSLVGASRSHWEDLILEALDNLPGYAFTEEQLIVRVTPYIDSRQMTSFRSLVGNYCKRKFDKASRWDGSVVENVKLDGKATRRYWCRIDRANWQMFCEGRGDLVKQIKANDTGANFLQNVPK